MESFMKEKISCFFKNILSDFHSRIFTWSRIVFNFVKDCDYMMKSDMISPYRVGLISNNSAFLFTMINFFGYVSITRKEYHNYFTKENRHDQIKIKEKVCWRGFVFTESQADRLIGSLIELEAIPPCDIKNDCYSTVDKWIMYKPIKKTKFRFGDRVSFISYNPENMEEYTFLKGRILFRIKFDGFKILSDTNAVFTKHISEIMKER